MNERQQPATGSGADPVHLVTLPVVVHVMLTGGISPRAATGPAA